MGNFLEFMKEKLLYIMQIDVLNFQYNYHILTVIIYFFFLLYNKVKKWLPITEHAG